MEQKSEKTKRITLFVLILLVLAASLAVFLYNRSQQNMISSNEQLLVVVEVKGEQVYAVPLSKDTSLVASSELGENVIRIENGEVYVEEADCPNQICVHAVSIKKAGESIICLPHRMVVSLTPAKAIQ